MSFTFFLILDYLVLLWTGTGIGSRKATCRRGIFEEDEDGWRRVERQNYGQSKGKNHGAGEWKNITTTFFVSNLLGGCDTSRLWKVCMPFGCIVDVYVAKKKDIVSGFFTFVRFIRVGDVSKLISSLNFDGNKIKVIVTKYGRKSI